MIKSNPFFFPLKYRGVTVHSHVNHSADWHGGCTFWLECISEIDFIIVKISLFATSFALYSFTISQNDY